MFRPRVIPVLLLKGDGLVKTTAFDNPVYIGDPMNAVRIFNMRQADELIFLDINATPEGRTIDTGLVRRIGEECFMPFAVGGGITTVAQVREIFRAGAEKVVLCTAAVENPDFITRAADAFGSQSIVVCIDAVRQGNGYEISCRNAQKRTGISPTDFAREMERRGAGEIIINAVDRESTLEGYDLDLVRAVSDAVSVPVVSNGGAGTMDDLKAGLESGASAVAAGSMFVYQGPRRGVLISFPEQDVLLELGVEA